MHQLSKILITAVFSAALTALVLQWLAHTPKPPSIQIKTANNTVTGEHLTVNRYTELLTTQLNAEREARETLQQEVEWLQSMLDELMLSANNNTASPPKTTTQQLWFDQQALKKLGINQIEIDTIETLVNKAELDKLYLRNKTSRGGEFRSKVNHPEFIGGSFI
jgi:hypothetical protein